MKKTIGILVVLTAMLVVVPAAAGGRDLVGGQINIHPATGPDPVMYTAGEPFHVIHGWAVESPGFNDFRLYIDGVRIRGGLRFITIESTRPFLRTTLVAFNFPDGMTGTHTFKGEWLIREGPDLSTISWEKQVIFTP